MPNYVYSTVAFSGSEEAIHKLIKIALENSRLQSTGDLRSDFARMVREGKTLQFDKDSRQTRLEDGLTARTFLPMPESFLRYDTTNYPDLYPDAVKEQQERFGVVGWYDYNKQTLGVKGNFALTEVDLQPNEIMDGWDIFMDTETAWDYPDEWLIRIKAMVPELDVNLHGVSGMDDEGHLIGFDGYVEDGVLKEGRSLLAQEKVRRMIEIMGE